MPSAALREHVAGVVGLVLGLTSAGDAVNREWDSLQQIEVVLAIEDEFGVTIAEADIPRMQTVDAISAHLETLRASS